MTWLRNGFTYLKTTLDLIKLPTGLEAVIIIGIVLGYAFMNAFTICGDCFFGYAITERLVRPEWYHAQDLVVNGGAGNFLFYRLLAKFPFFVNNYNVRDFVVSTPLTFLLVLAWYNVFGELVKNKKIVLLAIFFLLFSDTKLFLHGYPIPFFILTSIGSIHWLQIFGFFYFLRKKSTVSFGLIALSSYLHPASGLVFLGMLAVCLVWQTYRTKQWSDLVAPFTLAGIISLPIFLFFGQGIGLSPAEHKLFFDLTFTLRQTGWLLIDQYLSTTYLYTFATFALIIFVYIRKKFVLQHQTTVLLLMVIGFVGSGLWLLNAYFFQNLPFFYTAFIARAFYLIKPLSVLFVVLVSADLFSRKHILVKLLSLALLASLVSFSSLVGGIIIMAVLVFYICEPYAPWLAAPQSLRAEKIGRAFLLGALVIIVGVFGYVRNNKLNKLYQLLRGENTFNFSFDFERNYSVSRTNPAFSELVDWAKQYQGKLFLVPLDGRNDFVYFRYLTKNGIYANIDDMGQLNYSPADFLTGYYRMTVLGFRIGPRDTLDFSGYNRLDFAQLKATGADFAIFDTHSLGYRERTEKPIFQTDRYRVYQLKM